MHFDRKGKGLTLAMVKSRSHQHRMDRLNWSNPYVSGELQRSEPSIFRHKATEFVPHGRRGENPSEKHW